MQVSNLQRRLGSETHRVVDQVNLHDENPWQPTPFGFLGKTALASEHLGDPRRNDASPLFPSLKRGDGLAHASAALVTGSSAIATATAAISVTSTPVEIQNEPFGFRFSSLARAPPASSPHAPAVKEGVDAVGFPDAEA